MDLICVFVVLLLRLTVVAPAPPRHGRSIIQQLPNHMQIGLSELSIGSVRASKGQFPFIVSLQIKEPFQSLEHNCGGVIISHHTVLTAAHCVVGVSHIYEAVAGEHDLYVDEGTEQRRLVARFVSHPNYVSFTQAGFSPNDVALLFLTEPFVFNDFVQPIKLAYPGTIPSGTTQLSGWGMISYKLSPNVLMTEELPVVNHTTCLKAMRAQMILWSDGMLPDTILCTGPLTGGMGSCAGDSGGPLVQNGVLVGLVSWGSNPCARPGFPSGFTRVSAFTEWILQKDREIRQPPAPRSSYTTPRAINVDDDYYDYYGDGTYLDWK